MKSIREHYIDSLPHNLMDTAREFLAKPDLEVNIYHNNEIGDWLWAVHPVGTDFWLDAFASEDQALDFCNGLGLRVKGK